MAYIDSERGKQERTTRERWLTLNEKYYIGDQYEDSGEWQALVYPKSSEVFREPRITINIPSVLVDKPVEFAFKTLENINLIIDGKEKHTESEWFSDMVSANDVLSRIREWAHLLLLHGDVLLTFNYNMELSEDFFIWVISAMDFDYEHQISDPNKVLFIRRSYKYFDDSGKEYYHQEDWYSDFIVVYQDAPVENNQIARTDFTVSTEPNQFGFIPVSHVRFRRRPLHKFGTPIYRGNYHIFDDINWKYSHRSKNLARITNNIVTNAEDFSASSTGDDRIIKITGTVGDQATFFKILENPNRMDDFSVHIMELKEILEQISGAMLLRPQDVSSMGRISRVAMELLMDPLLSLSYHIRESLNQGITNLVQLMLQYRKALGFSKLSDEQITNSKVDITYGPLFELTEEEKSAKQLRLLEGLHAGLYTPEYVLRNLPDPIDNLEELVTQIKANLAKAEETKQESSGDQNVEEE